MVRILLKFSRTKNVQTTLGRVTSWNAMERHGTPLTSSHFDTLKMELKMTGAFGFAYCSTEDSPETVAFRESFACRCRWS